MRTSVFAGLCSRTSTHSTFVDPSARTLAGVIVDGCLLQIVRTDNGDELASSLVYWSGSSQSMTCVLSLLPSRLNIPPSVSGVDGKLTFLLWCLVCQHMCPDWSDGLLLVHEENPSSKRFIILTALRSLSPT